MNSDRELYRDKREAMELLNRRNPEMMYPRNVTQEDIKVWNDCIRESIYKAGLPFAIVVQFLKPIVRQKVRSTRFAKYISTDPGKWPALRNTLGFVTNVFVGVVLYSPVCFERLKDRFLSNQMRNLSGLEEENFAPKTGGSIAQLDDINFESGLDPKLDGPDSNFSHLDLDLESSYSDKPDVEDAQGGKKAEKIPTTTYEERRRYNRQLYQKTQFDKAFGSKVPAPMSQENVTEKPSEPPPRRLATNKYGDYIEG